MLKRLHSHLDENKIPYYWDSRCNLLDALGYAVNNMKYKIQRIIKEIDNSLDNPEVLAKYLCEYQTYIKYNIYNCISTKLITNLRFLIK